MDALQSKKQPFDGFSFTQLQTRAYPYLIWLAQNHPQALAILLLLEKNATILNTVQTTQQVLCEVLHLSPSTVQRAISVLKRCKCIDQADGQYYINSEIFWKTDRDGAFDHSFSAPLILSNEAYPLIRSRTKTLHQILPK